MDNGWGARRIAGRYGWKPSSVQNLIRKYRVTRHMKSKRNNCGRRRKTDSRTDRAITRAVVGTPQKRRISSRDLILSMGLNVSPRTVRRRLVENGFHGLVAAQKPHLRPENVERRLKWAKERVEWTPSK